MDILIYWRSNKPLPRDPVTPVAGLKHISGNSKFCQGVERKCFSFKAKKSELKYSIYQPNHCSYPLGTHTG